MSELPRAPAEGGAGGMTARSPAEWALLGLIGEEPTHGFALARHLRPDGDLGRIWSVSRPLAYQGLARLAATGWTEPASVQPGSRGPNRTLLQLTPAGRGALEEWLATPVAHVRDARSHLLLKLAFLQRAGRDPSALCAAQRAVLLRRTAELEEGLASAEGADGFDRTLLTWRLVSARAVLDLVDWVEGGAGGVR